MNELKTWSQKVREAALKDFPDKVRAVKIIERDDDAEHGGDWSNLVGRTGETLSGTGSLGLDQLE